MSEVSPLEGAIQALSIFNMIAFLWLGLTVVFNAEYRSWGTWVAGGGLILGGLFFAVHSAIFGSEVASVRAEAPLFWALSWLPFVGLPFLWYLVMAWYTGVLRSPIHRFLVIGASIAGVAVLAALLAVGPLPPRRVFAAEWPAVLAFKGLPISLVIYPGYSAACVLLSLAALLRPQGSDRFMGEVARLRARPWLVAASITLLGVSGAVAGLVTWFLLRFGPDVQVLLVGDAVTVLDSFDLMITALLTLVGVLVGRAVASYEIFTGKVLPRGGLRRQWRNSLVLAASFGVLVGLSYISGMDTVFLVVLAALLITALYAVHSWRVYEEREESIHRLRPFVTSERMYARLLVPGGSEEDLGGPFRALCADVLGAQVAFLLPVGPLAGSPLAFPSEEAAPVEHLALLVERVSSPQLLYFPVPETVPGAAVWGVPLWSERGLSGLLLLGPKTDGALYTQEEIELARATGERLLDTQASATMARRLMVLQRERLAETQVVDRRTRRLLHDEVLPRLHAVLLLLSTREQVGGPPAASAVQEAVDALVGVHQEIAALLRSTPPALAPEVARLGVVAALRQVVDGEFAGDFDGVAWEMDSGVERAARRLPATSAEVLFYAVREAIRNSARHGRGGDAERPLSLILSGSVDDDLSIIVDDNGVGFDTHSGSRGHGLVLHTTMMAVIGGTLAIDSTAGVGTRTRLTIPVADAVPAEGASARVPNLSW